MKGSMHMRRLVSLFLLGVLLLSLLPFTSPIVEATTTNLYFLTTSNGDVIQLSCSLGVGNSWQIGIQNETWSFVDTYGAGATNYKYDLFVLADHTIQYGTISNISINVCCFKGVGATKGGNGKVTVKTHSLIYNDTAFNIYGAGAVYSYDTWNMVTNPNTGAAWTWSEVDSLQVGISLKANTSDGSSDICCQHIVICVTYTPSLSALTNATTSITTTTATLNGVAYGENSLTCGFWYNTSTTNRTHPGTNITCTGTYDNGAAFNKAITGLTPGQLYYFRAWTSKTGVGFFNDTTGEKTFFGYPYPPSVPRVTTVQNNLTVQWTNFSQPSGVTRYTMVRYKTLGFPNSITDGSLLVNTTTVNTSKIYYYSPGTTYYFSMWTFVSKSGKNSWSSTYNTTSILAPTHPLNLAIASKNNTRMVLTWTKGTGNTVVVRNLTKYPPTHTNGTTVYNGTLETYTNTGLSPSTKYYYRAWDWNGSSYSLGFTNTSGYTCPSPPTSVNPHVVSAGSTVSVNISWVKGVGSDRTIVRRSSTTQPVLPTDGTGMYNNTGLYYNNSGLARPYYFTVFSYNSTTNLYSSGVNASWYVVWVKCFNESSGLALTNWGLFITNNSGSETYQKTNCNNPFIMNVSNVPTGNNCIIIFNKTGYETRTYTQDIVITGNIYITGYLVPVNGTNLYQITVINEINQPVKDCTVVIARYINATVGFENVTSLLTDGYGQCQVFLYPYKLYKLYFSATGYISSYDNWQTDDLIFTKTFKIYSKPIEPQPPIVNPETIHFTVDLSSDNTTIWANYSDSSGFTNWTTLDVSMLINGTIWVHLGTYTNSTQSWTTVITPVNRSNDYYFNLTYNNQYLGTGHIQRVIEAEIIAPWTPEEIEDRFSWMGFVPFGVMNVLLWLFFIAVCYYADSKDAGKIIFVFGVICIGLSSAFLHIISDNVFLLGNGVGLGVLFMVIGLLMERGRR
jgi:hypothetical protein